MNFLDALNTLESLQPVEQAFDRNTYDPVYQDPTSVPDTGNWAEEYKTFKTQPTLYNMDNYISPYPSEHWDGTSQIIASISDEYRMPPLEPKLDPNKIFSNDITAFKNLAADQLKITKMFEKRLMERLADKNAGIDEETIEALNALTSARSAVTSINKEQVAIKKTIADLKIKQAQNNARNNAASNGDVVGNPNASMNVNDIGRSVLDSIFDAPTTSMQVPVDMNYPKMDSSSALIDGLLPNTQQQNQYIQYENSNPKTYVVVGDSDDDFTFETYTQDGELIPDYPNPTTAVTQVDRENKFAVDEMLVQYPLKSRNE